MPSSHTQPEKIVDRNGKATTVHKGKAPAAASSNSRIGSLNRPPAPSKTVPQPLRAGSYFYAGYADGMVKYVITNVRMDSVVTVSPPDEIGYPDMKRIFTREEALAGLKHEARMQDLSASQDYFWDSREDGEIVHYHNAFGNFVRGEIVTRADGSKAMQPTALIGNWDREVSRDARGEVRYGYYGNRIFNPGDENTMTPNEGSMWENMSESEKASTKYDFIREAGGIENVAVVDLSVPELSAQEAYDAEVYKKSSELNNATASVSSGSVTENIANIRRILNELEALDSARP